MQSFIGLEASIKKQNRELIQFDVQEFCRSIAEKTSDQCGKIKWVYLEMMD